MRKRRLFYALPVDLARAERWAAAFAGAFERCAGPRCLQSLRRVPASEWHLTLAFLGMTPEDALPELSRAVGQSVSACAGPRVVELAGGAFPERSPARVLWWGPREDSAVAGSLESIAGAVREAVESVLPGSLGPGDSFRAHLTAARVPRGERGPSREGRAAFEAERLACDWRPSEVLLYESRQSSGGPRYRVLDRHALSEDRGGGHESRG